MTIGRHEKFLDVIDDDWKRVAKQLGIRPEQAIAWVEALRAEVPAAFERAIRQLPQVRDEAAAMAERIVEHVNRTWRPDLERDPRRNIDEPKAVQDAQVEPGPDHTGRVQADPSGPRPEPLG